MIEFRIVTSIEKSAKAAQQWESQYLREGVWGSLGKGDSAQIYSNIVAANGDPAKIAKAIGNTSWSHYDCSVCEKTIAAGIEFSNYDDSVIICETCLNSAFVALKAFNRIHTV